MNIDHLSPSKSSSPGRRLWLRVLSLGLGLACWQITSEISGLATFILPQPIAVWNRFVEAITNGTLLTDIGITLSEVLLGLVMGVTLATILGYSVAKSSALERVLAPYLVASQAIPIVAIAPLLVLWFGYGIFSKMLICALIVFFPVLINTIVGIRAVPNAFYDLMNSLHSTKSQILLKVEIPAALPIFLGGLRIGATIGDRRGGRRAGRCELRIGESHHAWADELRHAARLCRRDHAGRNGIGVVCACVLAGKKIPKMAGEF